MARASSVKNLNHLFLPNLTHSRNHEGAQQVLVVHVQQSGGGEKLLARDWIISGLSVVV
jgi:hypothetical protein